MSAIVIAAVVAVNLLAAKLPSSVMKPDFSSVKLYDFDEKTKRSPRSFPRISRYTYGLKTVRRTPSLRNFSRATASSQGR